METQNQQGVATTTPESPYRVHHGGGKTDKREILILDNVITVPDVKTLMTEAQYEFLELIPDSNLSPGIFGTKPILKSDTNAMNLGAPLEGSGADFPIRSKTIVGVSAQDEGPPADDPGSGGAAG